MNQPSTSNNSKTWKILIWHSKHGDIYFKCENDSEYLKMFQLIDDSEYYYPEDMDEYERSVYYNAKKGDKLSAKRLIDIRQDGEYEGFSIEIAT